MKPVTDPATGLVMGINITEEEDDSYLKYRLKHTNQQIDEINRQIAQLIKDRAVHERELDEIIEKMDKTK